MPKRKTGTVFLPYDALAGIKICTGGKEEKGLLAAGVYTMEDSPAGDGNTWLGAPGYANDKVKVIAGEDNIKAMPNSLRRRN